MLIYIFKHQGACKKRKKMFYLTTQIIYGSGKNNAEVIKILNLRTTHTRVIVILITQ